MKTLKVTTTVGEFTRKTATAYTHVNVWKSPRAEADIADPNAYPGGISGRWKKDRGYGVTWHSSLKAAQNAGRKYIWDGDATLIGTFDVGGQS